MRRKEILLRWLALMLVAAIPTGCVTLLPKAPHPYSYHQENKTCDYWIYHKYWNTREAK